MSEPYLIVLANFYQDIADALLEGAVKALEESDESHEIVTVPGALEIPAAIAFAQSEKASARYKGYIALGCVIRGETSHYDIVAGESARALMDLSVRNRIAIGNGILTVESRGQAMKRADAGQLDKGGHAARAAIEMWTLKQKHDA